MAATRDLMKTQNHKSLLGAEWLTWPSESLFALVSSYWSIDENDLIEQIYPLAYDDKESAAIESIATTLIEQARVKDESIGFAIEKLLQEYSLDHEDGVTLMCLAEALLRIPDPTTRDALLQDKLSHVDWHDHINENNPFFVNVSAWGLMIAGRLVNIDESSLTRFLKKSTKPLVRAAVEQAMKIMGQHFVLGRTLEEAMRNARPYLNKGYDYSYDMLGESAISREQADNYFKQYSAAIESIALQQSEHKPSLSIKLSALHPRFEETQRGRVLTELRATVMAFVRLGIQYGIGITIDAEEAERLELTLAIFEKIYREPELRGWGKFGLAVQAYSKRALPTLCWLTRLAKILGDTIPVRLVKGAYWDSEIKHAQMLGLENYPVFTRKAYTDTAYLACARFLLSPTTEGALYPQFATHNAHSIASILTMVPEGRDFECQRLHGMGDSLYDSLLEANESLRVRIYAPVGNHKDLLPYLVRRLLENGANTSFVHHLSDEAMDVKALTRRPLLFKELKKFRKTSRLVLPVDLFSGRKNSQGLNLATKDSREFLFEGLQTFQKNTWSAGPLINGKRISSIQNKKVTSPSDHQKCIGEYQETAQTLVDSALLGAEAYQHHWNSIAIEDRCQILENFADKLQDYQSEFIVLCQQEAGKTLQDAIDELREAIDFCRYYAQLARQMFKPRNLAGPTGESNQLLLEGKGVFVCISPWNFPLAIFIGQIAAALVTGNTVIAKPAETATLIAFRAIELLFESDLPTSALQFLPGSGPGLGAALLSDKRVAGVIFTGSTATARSIQQTLANRNNTGLATVIAETGGLNAMIADSTALPEQVAKDVISSAFSSAGQRCSACRILYVQDDIAEKVIDLLKGSMRELSIGDPQQLCTDIGPVIDQSALQKLSSYITAMEEKFECYQVPSQQDLIKKLNGNFVAPTLIQVDSILDLEEEQFGPILHLAQFKAGQLEAVIKDINSMGYGLTLGIHTRNKSVYQFIAQQAKVGNVYINRNQIGAVVGANPFGGRGLSGTGPKAGGPHYLQRFVTEKTITNNEAAIGGNISLLIQKKQ